MSTSPPAALHDRDEENAEPAQPELRIVRDGDPPSAAPPEPDTAGDDEIAPEAPWQYRMGKAVADLADQLPGVWGQRPASFAERVEHSLSGDWTTADQGQSAKRMVHLIGMLACLAADGLIVTPQRFLVEKPSRLGIFLLAALLLGYIF